MTIRTTLLAASLILASGGAWAAAKTDLGSRARIHAEKHGLVLTPVDAKTKKYAAAPARMKGGYPSRSVRHARPTGVACAARAETGQRPLR